jgi:hypothetical protein
MGESNRWHYTRNLKTRQEYGGKPPLLLSFPRSALLALISRRLLRRLVIAYHDLLNLHLPMKARTGQ